MDTASPGHRALRKGRVSIPDQVHLVTTATHNRASLFRNWTIGRVVVAEMRRLHDAGGVQSLAFVLMPDHLHWLIGLRGPLTLSTVMKRFKGRSARAVNAVLARTGLCGSARSMITRCVARRTCGRSRGTSSPIRCGLGSFNISAIIPCGTQHGCRLAFVRDLPSAASTVADESAPTPRLSPSPAASHVSASSSTEPPAHEGAQGGSWHAALSANCDG
jgi:REP element-mobilizing transposase RayT